jgi:hypothetical protein
MPQFELSVAVLVHAALQNVCPVGHRHVPDWQVSPPEHALPQVPQFALSVCVFVQVPAHDVCPATGHPASVPPSAAASGAASATTTSATKVSGAIEESSIVPSSIAIELSAPLLLPLSTAASGPLSTVLSIPASCPPVSGAVASVPLLLASTPAHWVAQLFCSHASTALADVWHELSWSLEAQLSAVPSLLQMHVTKSAHGCSAAAIWPEHLLCTQVPHAELLADCTNALHVPESPPAPLLLEKQWASAVERTAIPSSRCQVVFMTSLQKWAGYGSARS